MKPKLFCGEKIDVWKGMLNERKDKERQRQKKFGFEVIKPLVGKRKEIWLLTIE